MDLPEIISEDKILLMDSHKGDKNALLKEVLEFCLKNTELEQHKEQVWETLLEREQSMSTGIGLGVAIPHCSITYINEIIGVLALLKNGIDFQAVDDEPVRIIALLLIPKNKIEKHIKTLASIARLCNDENFRDKILSAKSPSEAYSILKSGSENSGTS